MAHSGSHLNLALILAKNIELLAKKAREFPGSAFPGDFTPFPGDFMPFPGDFMPFPGAFIPFAGVCCAAYYYA